MTTYLHKKIYTSLVLFLIAWVYMTHPAYSASNSCPTLLNKTYPRLQDEKPISLCQYSGQVILVVNTASYCGYTYQYEELEKLQMKYKDKDKGFTVLGFPSNDFGSQEPKSNKEIADFCANTFGVKFPMFAKSVVKGSSANALYKELSEATGQTPSWNFYKYLIGKDGQVIGAFKSATSPLSPEIEDQIIKALAK
jgi:glutathione peroxidase